jgi:hypothetical protein
VAWVAPNFASRYLPHANGARRRAPSDTARVRRDTERAAQPGASAYVLASAQLALQRTGAQCDASHAAARGTPDAPRMLPDAARMQLWPVGQRR